MPRSNFRGGHDTQEVGAAILSAWFKVLPTAVPITSVTLSPITITTSWKAFKEDELIYVHHVEGTVELNDDTKMPYKVGTYTGAATFTVLDANGAPMVGSGFHPYKSGGVVSGKILELDTMQLRAELEAVLNQILSKSVHVEVDPADTSKIIIVVPRVPDNIYTRQDLLNYLEEYHRYGQGRHYHEELGTAVLFGCR